MFKLKALCFSSLFVLANTLFADISFTGTALVNPAELSLGNLGVLIVDSNNNGFASLFVTTGGDVSSSSSYDGFTVLGTNTAAAGFLSDIILAINPTFMLGAGVNAGDHFAVLVFENSTSTTIYGDAFRIWTDTSWVIPADPSNVEFSQSPSTGQFQSLSSSASFTGIVGSAIPEPATFAMLFGAAVLGLSGCRRRRQAC